MLPSVVGRLVLRVFLGVVGCKKGTSVAETLVFQVPLISEGKGMLCERKEREGKGT